MRRSGVRLFSPAPSPVGPASVRALAFWAAFAAHAARRNRMTIALRSIYRLWAASLNQAAVFDAIEWRRLEALVEELFSQAGFIAKSQSHGADGGVDIWLCSKHQTDGVPVSIVREGPCSAPGGTGH
jgi:restriction endonuclease